VTRRNRLLSSWQHCWRWVHHILVYLSQSLRQWWRRICPRGSLASQTTRLTTFSVQELPKKSWMRS
jgi:hypothetical protein